MSAPTPLAGIKVVEFTHMVMGPTVGHILAGLGAEVVRVEPIGGDQTRRLLGSGAGYFPMYNRGKQSVCLDLKSPEGLAARLAAERGARIVRVHADEARRIVEAGTKHADELGYKGPSSSFGRKLGEWSKRDDAIGVIASFLVPFPAMAERMIA